MLRDRGVKRCPIEGLRGVLMEEFIGYFFQAPSSEQFVENNDLWWAVIGKYIIPCTKYSKL